MKLDVQLEYFLAMSPPPKVVWFQQGIRHRTVAAALEPPDIEVVPDRCTLADPQRLGMHHG